MGTELALISKEKDKGIIAGGSMKTYSMCGSNQKKLIKSYGILNME